MLSNHSVIENFINGIDCSNVNLRSINGKLINYATTIAQKTKDGNVIVNESKYSVSTSKIQGYLRYALTAHGIDYIPTTKRVPMGANSIGRYK